MWSIALRRTRASGWHDRPEPVVVVLEDVGVDRADADAALLGVATQAGPVVHLVPRDVQRHRGRHARELVDVRGVVDLLEHGARRPRPGEGLEARARIAVAPGGRLDALPT